ncbi:hypothetical protein VTN49DRAFT_6977 [Thermomyces lanuginosus]|uniref:uncharacterized protein n=1 Tax=Thermomyces lanuginosus TaxID=5541 RepID=UPI00374428CA
MAATPDLHEFPVPPNTGWDTLEAAEEEIIRFTASHGYAIIRERSILKNGEVCKVYLRCDRGGDYTLPVAPGRVRKRNRGTRQTNCPFSGYLRFFKRIGRWEFVVRNPQHNHQPSPPITHPSLRARALRKHEETIRQQLDMGMRPRDIYTYLQLENQDQGQGDKIAITIDDIRNLHYRHRMEQTLNRGFSEQPEQTLPNDRTEKE